MGLSLHPSFGINFWAFTCEGEIVINFPPPNECANRTGLGAIFTMHNQLSSK
jgi:hypothetical protein